MSEPQSRVDAFADRLREETPELDEVSRARMERDLVARRASAPERSSSRAPVFLAGLALGAVAAGALVYVLVGSEPSPGSEPTLAEDIAPGDTALPGDVALPEDTALPGDTAPGEAPAASAEGAVAFETLRDGVPVGSGRFDEGETVQTAVGQLLRVRFGGSPAEPTSLVEVAPESRVRFVRARGETLAVALERGSIRVEFHPERRGEERLTVRTRDGRVEVVGTAFEVRLGPSGTEVVVEEGTVRLVGGEAEPRLVSRGERAWLRRATTAEAEVPSSLPSGNTPGGAAEAVAEAESPPEPGAEAETAEPFDQDLQFALADRYFAQGRFDAARHELYAITRSGRSRSARAQAWIRVAEAFSREANPIRAAEAYRRAARTGRGTAHGDAALFALGRLLAEQGDPPAARAAYERYLEAAPAGPLAEEAGRALCRLGVARFCE